MCFVDTDDIGLHYRNRLQNLLDQFICATVRIIQEPLIFTYPHEVFSNPHLIFRHLSLGIVQHLLRLNHFLH